ncbi:swi5-dependent recombination DNA repair protein 1 homolog isoform X2 [Talpa occidentalis]|uniref:swi5-dependent recombination DNA repair protein 1 homolog isoform X2 n=1 Tax=Talpa occidentalis TaxID=50954 RepID=UPI00188F3B16|nr:swi5-dependent recombination DNA repair protein 1 homolog isoform X2 [Talpa occidentalis]XP_037352976.1 swi5-dependent recombination DNA repair protein 1 homolog isoform X2 [Talpa occidentalis]
MNTALWLSVASILRERLGGGYLRDETNGSELNEENQEPIFEMERPADSAVISPRTPQTSASPPSPHTSSSRKQPMSATLRERLRKTRSSFNSCYSVVKRLKVEDEENDQTFSEKPTSSTEENHLEFPENFKHVDTELQESTYLKNTFKDINAYESKSLDTGSCSDLQSDLVNESISKQGLNEEKAKLMKQVQEKEDLLRRLKLVKMYRSKNDLSQLQSLIKKWRCCSQLLLYELQSSISEENKKLSLTQLIDFYGLDDKLLHYNRNEEEFIGI